MGKGASGTDQRIGAPAPPSDAATDDGVDARAQLTRWLGFDVPPDCGAALSANLDLLATHWRTLAAALADIEEPTA